MPRTILLNPAHLQFDCVVCYAKQGESFRPSVIGELVSGIPELLRSLGDPVCRSRGAGGRPGREGAWALGTQPAL